MIQQIAVTSIKPSPLNPRKRFDEDSLAELAASIKKNGLMQNLVARPNGDGFELAAGERRLRAIQTLINAGDLPADAQVPVVVRDLTDLQLLELATTENMSRQDMSPLEEARAFQHMLELGSDVDTISAETGLSLATVRKRLALVERLSPVAQEALEAGQINLGQAQAFTTTSTEFQEARLGGLVEGERLLEGASTIKSAFQRQAPPVSIARFPLSRYSGTFTRPNIFSDEEEDRFDDIEQFRRLQAEAAQELLEEAKRHWAWAELRDSPWDLYGFEQLPEDESHDPKELGVIIIHDTEWGDGSIEIRERMRKRELPTSSSAPKAETDPAALTQKHQEQIARHRTRALQTAVVLHRRRFLTQLLILMLTPNTRLDSHLDQAWRVDLSDAPPAVLEALDGFKDRAPTVHALLTTTGDWQALPDTSTIWTELKELDEIRLDILLAIVTARLVHVSSGQLNDVNTAVFWGFWADEHLPTFADLGEEWLQLYRPARLQQVSETVLGFSGEGKTKKQLIALIAAAQSQDVPAELKLEAD